MKKNQLKYEALPDSQFELFKNLSNEKWINQFYLAGGTSVALRFGHRKSYDFDFFTQKKFSNTEILLKIKKFGEVKVITQTENIIHCFLNDFEISFFTVDYPLIDKVDKYNFLNIASLKDLFLMKLQAIAGRGSKKDFIDLYFLLKIFEFKDIQNLYLEKYGINFQDDIHLHKSLIYFEDAENTIMPEMIYDISWKQIKNELTTLIINQNKFLK